MSEVSRTEWGSFLDRTLLYTDNGQVALLAALC
jgi:hypothetical protein